MTTVEDTINAWLTEYDTPRVSVPYVLCDRHDPGDVAFTFIEADLSAYALTYGELADRSRRLATALAGRGVARGDRVAVLMGKRPELLVSMMAIWRLGAVHVPLFTAFAAGAIGLRVDGSRARLVITEPSQRDKLESLTGVDVLETGPMFNDLIDANEPLADSVAIGGDGTMLQLYTSGTTGKPKGVAVPARALAAFHSYMRYGLDVRKGDVFWNAADPGWAYGLYYGILGPLVTGTPNLLLTSGFTPESTEAVLRKFGVTNFAGAPTIYRALSKAGSATGLPMRRASSAGEPLTRDVVEWGLTVLGVEVRDHYGQTELGMAICNGWAEEVLEPLRDSSMGRSLPGFVACIVGEQIAIDVNESRLNWFTGYHEAPDKTAERFSPDGRWYLTGDSGRVDDDGFFYFAARNDDVILAAGYRIGPFEVESVIISHPSVADVAVVGLPDPDGVRGEVVAAYVVVADGVEPDEALGRELQDHVRDTYSKHAYPRVVRFVESLPKTPSGKVQRFVLRDLQRAAAE